MHTWEPAVLSQVTVLLPPVCETGTEFLDPGFGSSPRPYCGYLGSESQGGRALSLSLSHKKNLNKNSSSRYCVNEYMRPLNLQKET